MAGFLDGIFGRAPAAAAAPNPAPVNNGGPASKQQGGPANPGANPGNMQADNNAAPPPAGGPENPLAGFAHVFQVKAPDPAAPKARTLADPYLTPADPAALQAQIAKTNFAASIAPDKLQAAMNDPQALAEVINAASQNAFMAALQASQGLADMSAREAANRVDSMLDGRFRKMQINAHNPENAVLADPAVKPMVDAFKAMLAQSDPNLSAAQVATKTDEYFLAMAKAMTTPNDANQQANVPKEPDFSFLLSNS